MTAAFARGRDATFPAGNATHPDGKSSQAALPPALYTPALRFPEHIGKMPLVPQTADSFGVSVKNCRDAETVVTTLPSFEFLHFNY